MIQKKFQIVCDSLEFHKSSFSKTSATRSPIHQFFPNMIHADCSPRNCARPSIFHVGFWCNKPSHRIKRVHEATLGEQSRLKVVPPTSAGTGAEIGWVVAVECNKLQKADRMPNKCLMAALFSQPPAHSQLCECMCVCVCWWGGALSKDRM